MKVKAVLMRPDRTNDVVIVKKKHIAGKTFKHDNTTYVLHPDRFQVTWDRPRYALGLKRRYFSTFYFVQGHPMPLPVPDFQKVEEPVLDADGQIVKEIVLDSKGKAVMNGDGKPLVMVKTKATFPKAIDVGVSGEELAAIFNPWFYRTIAPNTKSMWDQIQFWATIGTLLVLIYLVYALTTGNYAPPLPPEPAPIPSGA